MGNRRSFKVGDWTVDPDLNRIESGSQQVILRPQAMELLVFLAKQSPEVVSIDEIIESVWHGKPMTTGSVYNCLNELRQAFGDDTHNPSYIETIARRGYRMVAAVDFSEQESQSPVSPATPGSPGLWQELQRRNVFKVGVAYFVMSWLLIQIADVVIPGIGLPEVAITWVIAILAIGLFPTLFVAWTYELTPDGLEREPPAGTTGDRPRYSSGPLNRMITVLLVAALALFAWDKFEPGSADQPGPVNDVDAKSIAVLPFIDLSPDGDQEYFAHGVSEEILNVISRFPDLKVVGRTSSFKFKDQDQDLRDIGQQLSVAYLLEGSVRRGGDQLRITAQLIKADDGFHVWSRDYNVNVGDIFKIQDEIAVNIAKELELFVLGEAGGTGGSSRPRSPVDVSAYDLLLLARTRINNATLEELEEAVEFLKQALEIEPDYAAAHAELAFAWFTLSHFHRDHYPQPEWFVSDGLIMQHVERALALDPGLADAYFARGAMWSEFVDETGAHLVKAEQDFSRALEINPNHARSYLWMSGTMRAQRRSWNQRILPARKAMELEPLWPSAQHYFVSLAQNMPALRKEKWQIIRQLKSGNKNPDQLKMFRQQELRSLMHEGRFAESVNLAESFIENTHEWSDFGETYINALYLIGAPEKMPKEFDGRGVPLALQFPAGTEIWESTYEEYCIFPNEKRSSRKYIMCSFEELLQGNIQQAQQIMEENLPVRLLDFRSFKFWHWTMNELRSVAITLATIHKLNGREDLALAYAEIEEEVLDSESENGAIESPVFSETKARLHALRGENEQAIDELEKMIGWGRISFRVFMHPVFNDLRGHPRYEALKVHWMDLINAERTKLGFELLELNPDAGPGNLPFLLNQ